MNKEILYYECPLCDFKHVDERIIAMHFWRHHREYRKQRPAKIFDSIKEKLLVISDVEFEELLKKHIEARPEK